MRQYTKEELKRKYILVFDTIIEGWSCVMNDNEEPYLYNSLREANADIDDPENEWPVKAEEYIHGRKTIFGKDGLQIIGKLLTDK